MTLNLSLGSGEGSPDLRSSFCCSLAIAIIMWKALVLLVFTAYGCSAQQVAKQKCQEYAALAKARHGSQQCQLQANQVAQMIEPDEFPATAMLGYNMSSGVVQYTCDAALISPDTLLSPGHCLQQKYGRPQWARVGATHTTLGIEVEIKESLCHPQYHPGHDIAVIKLKQPLNSSFIPACLDAQGVTAGDKGLGVGRPIGPVYKELWEKCPLKAQLEVRASSECQTVFPRQNISAEATICTKDPASGPGDCLSGPFYVLRDSCVQTVAGMASFGKPCRSETETNRWPSVYTRVSFYLPWIEKLTWPSPA